MKDNQINNGRDKISNLIIFIDNFIQEILIYIKKISFYFLYIFSKKYFFLKKNENLKNKFVNEKIFILGLAPSINNCDFTKFENKNVIMINRSFRLKEYEILKPKFHLFIDNKLALGIWPISFIDEVFKKNPDIIIFLNAKWYYLEKFRKYRNHNQIYWVKFHPVSLFNGKYSYDFTKSISTGSTVVECAITLSVYLGSKDINILGVEGNGISKLMCNQDSHWDGKDSDYRQHNSLLYANDMINSSRGIRQWHVISKKLKNINVNIYNLSKEGILDAYPYKSFEDATK